jgi:hypothetical protein
MEKGPSADNVSPAVLAAPVDPDEELEELEELDFEDFLLWAGDRVQHRHVTPRRQIVKRANNRFISRGPRTF